MNIQKRNNRTYIKVENWESQVQYFTLHVVLWYQPLCKQSMSSRRLPLNFKSRVWPIFRVRRWMKMATRRSLLQNDSSSPSHANDPGRDLFEACRNGDLNKVKKLVNHHNVNAKDTAGRKSSPLHFAAGMNDVKHCFVLMIVLFVWCLLFIWKFRRHV